MEATPYIPEREFTAYFEQVRLELARKIAHSGLSLSEIARATRMKWDTSTPPARAGRSGWRMRQGFSSLWKRDPGKRSSVVKLNNIDQIASGSNQSGAGIY